MQTSDLIKALRLHLAEHGPAVWSTLDYLLDLYRLHADTGTPLSQDVVDGG